MPHHASRAARAAARRPAPGAAQPGQYAQDRIGIGPGTLCVQQQERHRVRGSQPVRAQHRAALCALHRKAIAPPAVEAQQEAHPAVAQRAYAIEYDHREAGGNHRGSSSLHSVIRLPPRAASHRPESVTLALPGFAATRAIKPAPLAAAVPERPDPAHQPVDATRGPADHLKRTAPNCSRRFVVRPQPRHHWPAAELPRPLLPPVCAEYHFGWRRRSSATVPLRPAAAFSP